MLAAPGSDRFVVFDAQTTLDWQQLDADTLTFSLPAGTPDIAGNETSRELHVEVPLAATGTPVRGWDFNAATLPVFASWGGVQIVQSTPVCEGSCLQLGPSITACGEPGIAGQLDTRGASGPYGGPALAAGPDRTFTIANQCGIPSGAAAVAVNVTITNPSAAGYLTLYPPGVPMPAVSAIN